MCVLVAFKCDIKQTWELHAIKVQWKTTTLPSLLYNIRSSAIKSKNGKKAGRENNIRGNLMKKNEFYVIKQGLNNLFLLFIEWIAA